MSTRLAKQLIYGVLYGLVLLGFFSLIYVVFFRPAAPVSANPVCPQGGTCTGQNAQQLAIQGDVSAFQTSPGHFTFLAEIANPNADLAATSFDYRFDLDDASGTPIVSFPGRSFIYASQVKYVVAPNELASGSFDHAALTITNVEWAPAATLGVVPQLTFANIATGMGPTGISVEGEVTNQDIATLQNVAVIAVFKGASGGVVGASATALDMLAPGQAAHFSVIYPAVDGVDPARNGLFGYALRR